ncbi:MAG: hypothetical protein WC332_03365 [Clostridia bacterium]|jgi:hypothetical protein
MGWHDAVRVRDENGVPYGIKHEGNRPNITNYVWDTASLAWVRMTQPLVNTDTLAVTMAGVATESTLQDIYNRTSQDVDDDLIVKEQALPLDIVENYLFSKTDDSWKRSQCSTDGYQFVRVMGLYNTTGFGICDESANAIKASMLGKTGDSTYQMPRIDATTHTLQAIDHEHYEIHAGNHFFYSDRATLASAGTQEYMLTTPNTTKWAHMKFLVTGSAITQIDIYEGADRTGASETTVFNSNRNSLTAATVTVHKGTSGGTTDGTLIWTRKSSSATNQSIMGMESTQAGEKILKQATKYLMRITSGTADNLINLQLDWYEHINRTA